eukprot:MONOS_12861.1-p1 / transcript=MONOS_12861.1 / gene=MONOS_12861 / organism=Monocercomonoides_exilis_PA203 / gene_product=unspecified product / transcript_product=unspecified product / location=Mono_scaffold00743:29161-29995(+) / protein_length=174 / sequence_SO=supercontig / SO=protein_coding / is_pseudo=false
MKSEKGETDAFVFRRFLPNNCRAEAAKLKEEMKVLYDVKCSGNAWTSSFLPSEAAFRGIVFGELESLLCVLSADSKGAVAADLPGCVPAIGLWRTVSRIGTDVLPAQQHLRAIPVAAEGVVQFHEEIAWQREDEGGDDLPLSSDAVSSSAQHKQVPSEKELTINNMLQSFECAL